MSRLEEFLTQSVKTGKISPEEMTAIIGACQFAKEDYPDKFAIECGVLGLEAIGRLLSI